MQDIPEQTSPGVVRGVPVTRFAPLLLMVFGSGYCSLIYQTVWLREFRLLFGSSTPATAAVLGVFMGGLGAGSLFFAGPSCRWLLPTRVYAYMEFGIAVLAALSPLTLALARELYVSVGGTSATGILVGSAFRLLLAAAVIGPPAFLMGGTLPAIARAGTASGDTRRGGISLLYMTNTAGATAAVVMATFLLFERFGLRASLWSACVLNAMIAAMAYAVQPKYQMSSNENSPTHTSSSARERGTSAITLMLCGIGCISGFLFFLMELVWYRLASSLLGGSTYTFGILLSVALLGIAAGSSLYRVLAARIQMPLQAVALSCALFGLGLALPFALGDLLPVWMQQLRESGQGRFGSVVFGWYWLAAVMVAPASLVAGFQLPLIISALGTGERDAGRDTGWIYAANTFGSIVGSLLGGFGLLPLFGATQLWRFGALAMMATALSVAAVSLATTRSHRPLIKGGVLCALVVALGIVMVSKPGPTAFWRHSGVGLGRAKFHGDAPNPLRQFRHEANCSVVWEQDGWESAVANRAIESYAFIVNGKSDGSARGDAGTQVMAGLVGATLVPSPQSVLVVGLGTGCTAGWVAALDEVKSVKVIELERTVLRFAEECSPVNRNVLSNSKVSVEIGDAREHLITEGPTYDLIISEPSNPYRAGVATLFTQECYRSVRSRLNPGGRFVQWMQGYETDTRTVYSVLATLRSEFAHVEIWSTLPGDFVLVAGDAPPAIAPDSLRARIEAPIMREAMRVAWGAEGIDAFFSRFVADDRFTSEIAKQGHQLLNTDDRLVLEYIYARGAHAPSRTFDAMHFFGATAAAGADQPIYARGLADPVQVRRHRASMLNGTGMEWHPVVMRKFVNSQHAMAHNHANAEDYKRLLEQWEAHQYSPIDRAERRTLARAAVEASHPKTRQLIEALNDDPFAQRVLSAEVAAKEHRWKPAFEDLAVALRLARTDPWVDLPLHARALKLLSQVVLGDNSLAVGAQALIETPFPVGLNETVRRRHQIIVASQFGPETGPRLAAVLHSALEPWGFWDKDMLENRVWAYRKTGHPLAESAKEDLLDFEIDDPIRSVAPTPRKSANLPAGAGGPI